MSEESLKPDSRNKVLHHLSREKGLTVNQVATLCGIKRPAAQRLLGRMVEDGLVKKADGLSPHFYHLPSVKAYGLQSFKHEKICGDIYVSCQTIIDYWDYRDAEDFTKHGLKPDRATIIGGKIVFWEIDRSTMVKSRIIEKIEKYILFANEEGRQFSVVFACSKRRAASILKDLKGFINPSVHFYVTDFKELTVNPYGRIFINPWGKAFSIADFR
jgi:hypothetical protein